MSNTMDSYSKVHLQPLKDAETNLFEQSSHSRSPAKKNPEAATNSGKTCENLELLNGLQKIQNRNINEEIIFARSLVGSERTPAFEQFLDFLIKNDKSTYYVQYFR